MNCKICNFETSKNVGLAQHVLKLHDLSFLDYKLKYENLIIPNCLCGNKVKVNIKSRGININLTCGNSQCIKELQRKARLKFMKDNPEKTAWRLSNMSYPEKIFIKKCEELILNEKYLIVKERSEVPYFIDFAFEHEKVAVEIDGSQHNLEERKKSDLQKDKLLIELGWRVIRFTAKDIQTNIDLCIEKLLAFIQSNIIHNVVGIFNYKELKKEKMLITSSKEKERHENCGLTLKELNRALVQRKTSRPSYELLIQEIKELGYSAVGRKYGVSDNSIRKWIKTYEKYGI